jgi:hypothetical protein
MIATAILHGGVTAALAYYTERLGTPAAVTIAAAARLHNVSRQTLHAALCSQGRPPPRGRQPRAGERARSRSIRVTDEEWSAWKMLADEEGKGTSEWVRDQANRAAGR